jgi:hypothetical protein
MLAVAASHCALHSVQEHVSWHPLVGCIVFTLNDGCVASVVTRQNKRLRTL